jgi:signal transduction histidine kinase
VPRWEAAQVISYANVWARYLLGLPGALIAAIALRRQTQEQAPLQEFFYIARQFQVASLALGAYALFGGLFGPPASFFPANVINAETMIALLGMPPEVLRALAGLVLVISMVRGLEIFEVEVDRRLEEMEQIQVLRTERERVSRELHDGAIQTVYTAGLMAESVRKKMNNDDPLTVRMDRVILALHHAIRDLRQFITALEPNEAHKSLMEELRKLVKDPYLQSLIKIELTLNCDEDDCFPPARTLHVLAIVNEAFSNIIRHAHARQAWLTANHYDNQLEVTVADDGIGFPNNYIAGFGVRNMYDRARLLGGTLHLEGKFPQGTQVVLTIPWEDPR